MMKKTELNSHLQTNFQNNSTTKNFKRPSWHEYFFNIVKLIRTRSTCLRRQVGAIIVKQNRIIATGYNGAPEGIPHCNEVGGCLREKLGIKSGERHELCRGLHAEQNALMQAARFGISVEGADMYVTTRPCVICTKMIIASGIKRVFYLEDYDDWLAKELSEQSSVEFIQVKLSKK